ncbi:MAG: hypothetical protein ACMUJM_06605 [bacterium]
MIGKEPIILRIVTPERTVYDEEVNHVILPTIYAEEGIYHKHIPFLTSLKKGIIKIHLQDNEIVRAYIEPGIAQFRDNVLTVLLHDKPEISI